MIDFLPDRPRRGRAAIPATSVLSSANPWVSWVLENNTASTPSDHPGGGSGDHPAAAQAGNVQSAFFQGRRGKISCSRCATAAPAAAAPSCPKTISTPMFAPSGFYPKVDRKNALAAACAPRRATSAPLRSRKESDHPRKQVYGVRACVTKCPHQRAFRACRRPDTESASGLCRAEKECGSDDA